MLFPRLKPRRRFHWLPDLPDARDLRYSRQKTEFPAEIDLRPQMSDVENQLELGSCTAQALAGCLEATDKSKSFEASRLFIYYNERRILGTINEDSGAFLRDGIKSLARWGVCEERLHPHRIARFREKPSCWAYRDAARRKISRYERLKGGMEMLDCLASGKPFVFGFMVYSSFESNEVASTGIVPMPRYNERALGGHAVAAVGYKLIDNKKYFIVRNSWGRDWGDGGYFYMPAAYLIDSNLSDDFWTLTASEEQ